MMTADLLDHMPLLSRGAVNRRTPDKPQSVSRPPLIEDVQRLLSLRQQISREDILISMIHNASGRRSFILDPTMIA